MEIRTTEERLLKDSKDLLKASILPDSADYIADTSNHVGPYSSIVVLEDATIDISGSTLSFLSGASTDFIVPVGIILPGTIENITLVSGKIIAYKK